MVLLTKRSSFLFTVDKEMSTLIELLKIFPFGMPWKRLMSLTIFATLNNNNFILICSILLFSHCKNDSKLQINKLIDIYSKVFKLMMKYVQKQLSKYVQDDMWYYIYSYGTCFFILFVIFWNEIFISQVFILIINIKKVLLYVNDIIIIIRCWPKYVLLPIEKDHSFVSVLCLSHFS